MTTTTPTAPTNAAARVAAVALGFLALLLAGLYASTGNGWYIAAAFAAFAVGAGTDLVTSLSARRARTRA
jgi:hypothetical protein